jgi:hypothetical protein
MNYEIPSLPPPENTGREIWKVFRLQLLIFISYQLLLALLCHSGSGGFLFIDMLPLVLHWVILIILMIVSFAGRKKGAGLGYLISFLVICIVGFGSCWLISGIVDSNLNI